MYRYCLILLFLILPNLCWATNYCASAVLCYELTEGSGTTTADNSGNSNTGTFLSSGHPAWSSASVPSYHVLGSASNSLSYASGDYVDSAHATIINNLPGSGFTFVGWFNATGDGDSSKGRFFDKNWTLEFDGTGAHHMELQIPYSTTGINIVASTALGLSGWHMIAIRGDGSTTATNYHIYIDTTEVSYGTQTNGSGSLTTDATTNLQIGNRKSDELRTWAGNIGPILFFNTELTTTQLTEMYNYGPGGQPATNTGGGFFALV